MNLNIDEIKNKALNSIKEITDLKSLDEFRVSFLGKKGEITNVIKTLKDMSPDEKREIGKIVNDTKVAIENLIEEKKKILNEKFDRIKFESEKIDISMSLKNKTVGHLNPCTKVYNEVKEIFKNMGYEVVVGPEIEYDEYNFEKLNIEKGHPARDEQDTFYINDKVLLRTQTSPVQARVMEKGEFPVKMISAGRVFRSDSVDATHSPTFHQIEGLVVDKNITFSDLKGTLNSFAKAFFGKDVNIRFRPHHFPFTEPSAEMDVSCFKCGGKGCKFCKNEGWIEILGCGMVNPKVYTLCGLNQDDYQGFAFGIGIERLALLKYEIDDMRLLYENNVRFINQF